jgi:hypothetical protein
MPDPVLDSRPASSATTGATQSATAAALATAIVAAVTAANPAMAPFAALALPVVAGALGYVGKLGRDAVHANPTVARGWRGLGSLLKLVASFLG